MSTKWKLQTLLQEIQEAAHTHGYCVAVHGSLLTDIDFVAVPWVDYPSSQEEVYRAILKSVGGLEFANCEPELKPQGRIAYNFMVPGYGLIIDLSIFPPTA